MTAPRATLDAVNALDRAGFVALLGEVFENAPWVAETAAAQRPFASVAALHDAMTTAVRAAPIEERLAFLRGHPDLAGEVARAGAVTAASAAEQGSLGLDRLSEEELARFERLNAAYRERFGIPFIICVRRHTRDSILASFERRLASTAEEEIAAALEEIGYITRLRLVARIEGPGMPRTNGHLSTHVLDTVRGQPAAGVAVSLYGIGQSARELLVSTVTNADGRTDAPLIAGTPLRIGWYELHFAIGDYFARMGIAAAEPRFIDVVPIRFAIAEPEGRYHVPLLASPWSYTTYRGS
jgi:2-oxo-4-hydroxy-4-carboxy-5-ureidoimidazoline decarboxylase